MSANNDEQVGGDHYRKVKGEQHWDRAIRLKLDPFQYQITKYVERWKLKNGLEDLEKARHFLDKYIEAHKEFLPAPADNGPMPLELLAQHYNIMHSIQSRFVFEGEKEGMQEYTCKYCRGNVHALTPIHAYIAHYPNCRPMTAEPGPGYVNQG